jgi:hypothetical protein
LSAQVAMNATKAPAKESHNWQADDESNGPENHSYHLRAAVPALKFIQQQWT